MKLIEEGFFKRNRKVLIIALIIFLLFALIGAVITFVSIGDNYGAITNIMENHTDDNAGAAGDFLGLNTIEILIHNVLANFVVVIGGLLFSVISLAVVCVNALSIGSPFGADLTFACVSILPHAVIEYAASVFALAAAFNITKLEIAAIKNRSVKGFLNEHKTELKDILVLIIIMFVLLVIAAVIECNITELIVNWYYGF